MAAVMKKAMIRMTEGCLCAAMNRWATQARQTKRMNDIAKRVIGRLQHGAMVGSFVSWSDYTRWSVRSRKIVTRMVSRWKMQELSACFMSWCDDVRSSNMRVHTAICRSVAVVTSDPMGGPADTIARYRIGRIVEVFETRLVGGRLRARTADGWVWYVLENGVVQLEELSSDDLDQVRADQALRKAALKMHHAKASSAFEAWHDYTTTTKRMRYVAGRVVGRMQQGQLAGAFSGWSEYVSWSIRSKGIVERMLLKLTQLGQLKALSSWHEWTVESNARKHGLRQAVRRMERAGVSSAFDAWKHWSVESRTLRSAASRVVKCLDPRSR